MKTYKKNHMEQNTKKKLQIDCMLEAEKKNKSVSQKFISEVGAMGILSVL